TWLGGPRARRLTRSDRLALEAAHEAWGAAGLAESRLDRERTGVWIGATTGGMLEAEDAVREVSAGSRSRPTVRRFADFPVHVTGDLVADVLGLAGPTTTVVTACSSSANAIGFAADAIRAGRVDVALAGGVDAHCRMT